ncbi:MAG: diadenylate cyclase CdaA [Clostridia bacterium]|nr:diadenylate cyclase CdaA [Clostridia bacterium]
MQRTREGRANGLAGLWNQFQTFLWNIIHRPTWIDYIDILIIAFLIYRLVTSTRQTRAIQVLKGLAVIIVASYASELMGLTTLNWVLRSILNNGVIALMILFQPELRKALEQIGRTAKLDRSTQRDESQRVVDEITQCLLRLSRRRVGALIVFEQRTGLKDITESSGTEIDSLISAPLLENIFEPNTPLHDGAVIIRGTRIVSAACVLTLSENSSISRDLGTRHRAGLGVSENTDALVLIVSEETGIISMARGGRLTRYLDADSLRKILSEMYHEDHSRLWQWTHRARAAKGGTANDE